LGNLLVEHDKLISFLICSIDVEKSIGTTNRIFEWARIPERIEVFVKFDTEDYNQEPLSSEFHVMNSDEAFRFLTEEKGVL